MVAGIGKRCHWLVLNATRGMDCCTGSSDVLVSGLDRVGHTSCTLFDTFFGQCQKGEPRRELNPGLLGESQTS